MKQKKIAGTRTKSRSDLQKKAEIEIIELLSRKLGVTLEPRRLPLGNGVNVEVDGFYKCSKPMRYVLVEAWAHRGPARGSQPNKVAADILKLATVAKVLRQQNREAVIEAYIACVDDDAIGAISGKRWRAFAARTFGITTCKVDLETGFLERIAAVQRDQDIRNE